MYLEFFGLREKPFNVTPDPHFLYMSPSHQEAFANLLYGIRERKGFILVTGEVGTGKTTLLHNLLANLDSDIRSVFVYHTGLDFGDLLESIHHELGIPIETRTRAALLQSLSRCLIEELRAGRNVALIIDEAQNLSPEILENLRLLSNLETAKDKLLQIILVGQPELDEKMDLPGLRQLKQRIAVHGVIHALSHAESRAYIRHRLAVAGAANQGAGVLSEEAISHIVHAAGGIPRQLNLLCDNALLIAYADGSREVLSAHAREAIRDHGIATPSQRRRLEEGQAVVVAAPVPVRGLGRRRLFSIGAAAIALAAVLFVAYALGTQRAARTQRPNALPRALERELAARDAPVDLAPVHESPAPAPPRGDRQSPTGGGQESPSAPGPDSLARAGAGAAAARAVAARPEAAPAAADHASPSDWAAQRPGPDEAVQRPPAAVAAAVEAPRPASAAPAASGAVDTARTRPDQRGVWIPLEPGEPGRPEEAPAEPVGSPPAGAASALPRGASLREEFWRAGNLVDLQDVLDRTPRLTYTVAPGDNFTGLVHAATGRRDMLVLELVKRMNPQIANFDLIQAGRTLILPDLRESAASAPAAPADSAAAALPSP
ncbi:hypothetical protein FJ251_10250 [bacterium]|nr:hypothetical protein [bacterium]